jgi:hypothetical protein
MGLKVLRFITLLLVTLTLGLVFAHVMEIPGKLRLDGQTWLTVQQNLYVGFGVIGSIIEVGAVVLCWVMAFASRRRPAFYWTVGAAVAVSAGLAVWFALVSPMNTVLSAWTPETLPEGWRAVRDQWELGHAIHCVLFAMGFSALVIALLAETPDRSDRFVARDAGLEARAPE